MAGNFFTLTLDLIGPASPTISLNSGATYATATDRLVDATITSSDSDKTGYQMKIWGDLDLAWAKTAGIINGASTDSQAESDATLIAFSATKQLKLKDNVDQAVAESKTIHLKIYDDVLNASSEVTDSIILDTQQPTITITGPDRTRISEQSTKNVASFSFQVTEAFTDYKVKVVTASNAINTDGAQILISLVPPAGERSSVSTNASATQLSDTKTGGQTFPANTPITVKVNGTDLKNASPGSGDKIVKVFVLDQSGQWSS